MIDHPVHRIDGFVGEIIGPRDGAYEGAREIWNAMIDRRPAAILRCANTADVVAAIRYARRAKLRVAVRCGGHSIPGHSMIDDGLVIDLSQMQHVKVDAESRVSWVQGGCLLSAVDRATQAWGLATPAGAISHTGAGGLILGGGVGWIMRKHGLSVDNMLGAEVVTASGDVLYASDTQNTDLFWALRGGGGNFGVVTEFKMRLHERGPVIAAFTAVPASEAAAVLRRWREIVAGAPDDLVWYNFFRWLPDFPWVPSDKVGTPVLLMAMVWLGDHVEGAAELDALTKEFSGAAVSQINVVMPYLELQSMLDELNARGYMSYHKSGFIRELTETAIEVLVERGFCLQSAKAQLELLSMGGAIKRVAADATAFSHRNATWIVNICGSWTPQEAAEPSMRWVRETVRLLAPHLTAGSYVNFGGSEDAGAMPDKNAYGAAWDRLRKIKTQYDPDNFFRMNANVPPL